jgi:hypothetical protein
VVERSRKVLGMTTTPAKPAAAPGEFCGAFPGLSAAGSRVPCTASECPTEGICRALRRLDREAGLARANRDAATRYVDELLEATAEDSKTAPRTTVRRRGGTST